MTYGKVGPSRRSTPSRLTNTVSYQRCLRKCVQRRRNTCLVLMHLCSPAGLAFSMEYRNVICQPSSNPQQRCNSWCGRYTNNTAKSQIWIRWGQSTSKSIDRKREQNSACHWARWRFRCEPDFDGYSGGRVLQNTLTESGSCAVHVTVPGLPALAP